MTNKRPTRYLILEEKPNPSTDYFVLPWLREQIELMSKKDNVHQERATEGTEAAGTEATNAVATKSSANSYVIPIVTSANSDNPLPQLQRLCWHENIPPLLLDGALVVVVRYLTSNWRKALGSHRQLLHSLVYFFDDDIPDIKSSQGLPLKYRLKLYRYGARHFQWLTEQDAQLMVSTPYLKTKYGAHNPTLLKPRQLLLQTPTEHQEVQTQSPQTKKRCRVFYHATASHRKEIEWLYPVMKEVLDTCPSIEFEIVGDTKTRALYKKLPRTTVVDPMSWVNYQQFIELPGRNIGLAPHLDNPFNRARSYTKLFDIERAGAVGLLADTGPWANDAVQKDLYSAFDTEYSNRFLMIPMQQASWVQAIKQLADRLEIGRG